MKEYIATYTDVSKWNISVYKNTTGSRSKKFISNPATEDDYFIKGSKELPDGEIRYPTEFWSEIISSKIGKYLGFNVLDYNIGYNENGVQKIGCLSLSMINKSINKLTEGKVYLTGFNPNYNPDKDKKEYTFKFIIDTLAYFNYSDYIPNLLEIIVFDAIIGNSDRHQENWGIITNYKQTITDIQTELNTTKKKFFSLKRWGLILMRNVALFQSSKSQKKYRKLKNSDLLVDSEIMDNEFSKIYDSGCCLGRELIDDKVDKMLVDKQMLESYIKKGRSEIHWEEDNKKKNHFDLVKLLKDQYPDIIKKIINRVKERFNESEISEIIHNIDLYLPEKLKSHKLSDNRKMLMVKLITLRVQKLVNLV